MSKYSFLVSYFLVFGSNMSWDTCYPERYLWFSSVILWKRWKIAVKTKPLLLLFPRNNLHAIRDHTTRLPRRQDLLNIATAYNNFHTLCRILQIWIWWSRFSGICSSSSEITISSIFVKKGFTMLNFRCSQL